MSPSPLIFSAELEEILHDVAKDPNSILLRAPRRPMTAKLFEALGPPSPMAGGLSRAEHELIRTHRDELVAVLRDACWVATQEVGRKLSCLDRRDGLGQVQKLHSISSLQERAKGVLSLAGEERMPVLERLVTASGVSRPTVAELAAVSQRIQPSDHARTCAALDLIWRGRPGDSLAFSLEVAHHGTLLSNRIAGWRNAATALEMLGQLDQALISSQVAVTLADEYAQPAYSHFVLAVLAANAHEALRGAAIIDASTAKDDSLASFTTDLILRRDAGRWTPTKDSHGVISTIRHMLGTQSKVILDAIH